jgi:RHS repeat-associated protein
VYGLGLIGQQDSTGYSVYHFDFRGSTVALTNSSGAVTDHFTYGAYGELLTHTGSSDTPFLYNGRDGVLTDANGLYYMRARYYSPELKRFLNADSKKGSIDKIQTLNLYSFVIGNPITLIDPAGMSAELDENKPLIGSTSSIYFNLTTLFDEYAEDGYYSVHTVAKQGFKTTVGKEGKLLTYDQYLEGLKWGSTFTSSNMEVNISLGSVSVGHKVRNVTTSYGINLLTGGMTIGTETESQEVNIAGYGKGKPVTSIESTYNVNWSKIAKQVIAESENQVVSSAQQVASTFQKAGADIADNNTVKGVVEVEAGMLAAAGLMLAIAKFLSIVAIAAPKP